MSCDVLCMDRLMVCYCEGSIMAQSWMGGLMRALLCVCMLHSPG
jgi:hypothetical protein